MSPRKPRRWRKNFPYYKIQVYNTLFNSWKDEPRAYSSLAEARRLIRTKLSGQRARIVVVEREGRHALEN